MRSTAAVIIAATSALGVGAGIDHPHRAARAILLRIARTGCRQGGGAAVQGDHGRKRLGDQRLSMPCTTEGQNPAEDCAEARTSSGSERER